MTSHDDGVSDHIKDGGIQITQNLHTHYHNCVVPSTGATLISKKIIAAIAARTLAAIRARAFVNFWKTFLVLTQSTLVWCLTWQNVVLA